MYERWERYASAGRLLRCVDGQELTVVSCGRRNTGRGPDFLDAVLLVDGEIRVGSVEMHRTAEEWFAHRHDRDSSYSSVILHVVGEHPRRRSPRLPTYVLGSVVHGEEESDIINDGTTADAAGVARLSWQRLVRRTQRVLSEVGTRSAERRTLILRLFDALGALHNREPMRQVAESFSAWLETSSSTPRFNEVATQVFARAGFTASEVLLYGTGLVGNERADSIARGAATLAGETNRDSLRWAGGARPLNNPLRRLWAACALLHRILHRDMARRLYEAARVGSWKEMEGLLRVEVEGESYIGLDRARLCIADAVLPWALALALQRGDTAAIHGTLTLYRTGPTLQSNALIRRFETKHLDGRELRGAFWQQGAIEWEQRHGSHRDRAPRHLREPQVRYRLYRRSVALIGDVGYVGDASYEGVRPALNLS